MQDDSPPGTFKLGPTATVPSVRAALVSTLSSTGFSLEPTSWQLTTGYNLLSVDYTILYPFDIN